MTPSTAPPPPPPSRQVYHILLALAGGERHGYALMQDVEQLTGGEIRLGPGTLYGALKRLVADGLVKESRRRRDPEDSDERRRYYALTDRGRRLLGAETARMEQAVRLARRLIPRTEVP